MSPAVCVLGCTNLPESVAFWTSFGFIERSRVQLDTEQSVSLYGCTEPTTEVLLCMPDAIAGHLRLVSTSRHRPAIGPFDRGPHAIDLYTTDMGRSLTVASAVGANTAFGQLDYQFGPMHLQEGKCVGPDGVIVVFVDITRRRPSVLDRFPDRLHSEVHSVVNIVGSVDAANATWTGAAGLTLVADAVIDTPELGEFLQLPHPDRCRMSLLADQGVSPIRFEQLGFIDGGASEGVDISTWPLPGGLPLVEFHCPHLDEVALELTTSGHTFGQMVTLGNRSSACTSLDGVGQRYLLRSSASL